MVDSQVDQQHALGIPEIARKYNTTINLENLKLSSVKYINFSLFYNQIFWNLGIGQCSSTKEPRTIRNESDARGKETEPPFSIFNVHTEPLLNHTDYLWHVVDNPFYYLLERVFSHSIPPGQALDIYKLLEKCSSLGPEPNHIPSSNNFMYKYYLSKNKEVYDDPVSRKFLNLEQEQKYLAILRKQMKKSDDNSENERILSIRKQQTIEKPGSRSQPDSQEPINPIASKQNFKPQNELLNRWTKLVNKQTSSK